RGVENIAVGGANNVIWGVIAANHKQTSIREHGVTGTEKICGIVWNRDDISGSGIEQLRILSAQQWAAVHKHFSRAEKGHVDRHHTQIERRGPLADLRWVR